MINESTLIKHRILGYIYIIIYTYIYIYIYTYIYIYIFPHWTFPYDVQRPGCQEAEYSDDLEEDPFDEDEEVRFAAYVNIGDSLKDTLRLEQAPK